MKKLTTAILFMIFVAGTIYAGTVRIEDNATAATGLCSYDGALKAYSGASNGYAINLTNASAKGITWKVEVSGAGSYTLTWRYVNGSSSALTTAKLIINGTTVTSSLSFPKTADKVNFVSTSTTATLVNGVNQIRIETAASNEFADIDWIEISGNTIGAANCSAAIGSGGGGGTTVPVTGVTVSPTSSTITTAGGTVQLTATVAPSNATNKTVSWSSNNTSVATVNSSGLVTAIANGSATITVTTADGAKTATCAITVNISSTTVPVTGVTVSPTSSTITTSGGTVQLTATVSPSNATNKTVTWSSGNTSVATVSSTGLVTAVANGSATITVRTNDGGRTATCAITVNISSTPPTASTDMIGYAAVSGEGYTTTTGGSGGATRTISTLADLQSWAASRENNTTPEIVYINTKITSSSSTIVTIKHGANISIYGVGSAGELQNIGLNIRNYQNVIVRNLKIHEIFYPNDALTLDEVRHGWVDHCEFYSKIGSGIGVDTYDGLLDIKNGSRFITVSWCYLHHHMKCMLYGHTDNTSQQALDSQMRITFHHNWISYTDGRNPSLRFGALHMFNCYFEEVSDYGLAARDGAHAKVENCHYHNVKLSMSTDKFPVSGLPNGYICQSGNSFTGTTGAAVISQTGCDFWNSSTLPYSYTLDPVGNVATIVKANCGVGKVTNLKVAALENTLATVKDGSRVDIYPNPFHGSAQISFNLPETSDVKIRLTDMRGKQVDMIANGIYSAGENSINYNNSNLKSGLYIMTIEAGAVKKQVKLIVR
jgi:pectate lyase